MMQNTPRKKEYDLAAKSKAITSLVLRLAVAGYIVYLAWQILSGTLQGASSISVWLSWIICAVFAAAAAGFCFYAWKSYQRACKAAELADDPQEQLDEIEAEDEEDEEE